jgi:hypothetical protein
MEYRRKLTEAGVQGVRLDEEEDEESEDVPKSRVSPVRGSPFSGRGRGCGQGTFVTGHSMGHTPVQKVLAAGQVEDDEDDYENC